MVARMTTGALDGVSPTSPSNVTSPLHRERAERLEAPTQLCRWCIHAPRLHYESIPDADVENIRENDDVNPSSFSEWSSAEHSASIPLADWMQDSMKEGTFSATPPENLPISAEALSLSLQQDPELVRVDAWKVAIMAGNVDLILNMSSHTEGPPSGIDDIHPMHLAASFLDGGHACCNMLATLSEVLGYTYAFFHQRDQLGHTVLDTLMVNILRSHTTVTPEQVNPHFNPPHRFPGEEKDICGRWDADSPELRALFQHGYARVPTKWKHAFCHSSAQAICHSILVVIASPASPPVDALSGLFIRRCTEPDCGQELRLGPLHVAVAVAFYLAHRGMNGETLFGALAVIVCLRRLGAETSLKVEVSVPDLLGQSEPGGCSHHPMSAYELMQAVPYEIVSTWTLECQEGWACISQVLLLSDSPKQVGPSEDDNTFDNGDALMDDDSSHNSDTSMDDHDPPKTENCDWYHMGEIAVHEEWLRLPCGSSKLGLLWATIQVELLTYRRIELQDPWVSKNFSMAALDAWLEGKASEFHTPLITDSRIKEHTCCGWFDRATDFVMPIAEEVCTEHFMNMEDYGRASFTLRPTLCDYWLDNLETELSEE